MYQCARNVSMRDKLLKLQLEHDMFHRPENNKIIEWFLSDEWLNMINNDGLCGMWDSFKNLLKLKA